MEGCIKGTLMLSLVSCILLGQSSAARHTLASAPSPKAPAGTTCTRCRVPSDPKEKYCVGDLTQTCGATINRDCGPCYLWRNIYASCYAKKPAPANCHADYFYTPAGDLIEPKTPITGIEAVLAGTAPSSVDRLWATAWRDATTVGTPLRISPADLGLVINSYYYRSEHQLHIHIGSLSPSFRSCVAASAKKFKSFDTEWVAPGVAGCPEMWSVRIHTLDNVNQHIRDGLANIDKHKDWQDAARATGAAVTGDPVTKKDYILTMFRADYNGPAKYGDHSILA